MIRRTTRNPDGSCVVMSLDDQLNVIELTFVNRAGQATQLLDAGARPLQDAEPHTLTPTQHRILADERRKEYQRVYRRIRRKKSPWQA